MRCPHCEEYDIPDTIVMQEELNELREQYQSKIDVLELTVDDLESAVEESLLYNVSAKRLGEIIERELKSLRYFSKRTTHEDSLNIAKTIFNELRRESQIT